MTLDDLVPDPWPHEARTALAAWRQGHLIEGSGSAWLTRAGETDSVTGKTATGTPGTLRAAHTSSPGTGLLAVTSQTCDVGATGPGARHPTVQVSPVRDIGADFSSEKIDSIKAGESVEYVYLTQPPHSGVEYAVDLRISVPLSKHALVAGKPLRGFANEDDEVDFAERIATKARRAAVHDAIATDMARDLNTFLGREKKKDDLWPDQIEQVRVDIMKGTRLAPARIRLLVITDTKFSPADAKALRQWRTQNIKSLKKQHIAFAPMAFRSIEEVRAVEYRDSIPIHLPTLGRGGFV